MIPRVAPRARRGPTHALAHVNLVALAQEMRAEMAVDQCTRADTGPFALATWASWLALTLRLQERFPVTCAWVRSLHEHTTIMIGAMILSESTYLLERLTDSLREGASTQRSTIIAELSQLPCWMEAKIERLPPEVRSDLEKMLNTVSELFYEMAEILQDMALEEMASKTAETLLRCRFRRDPTRGRGHQQTAAPNTGSHSMGYTPRPSTSPELPPSDPRPSQGFPMIGQYESSEEFEVMEEEDGTGGTVTRPGDDDSMAP